VARHEQISVWETRDDGALVEYVCFRELETGRYWVWGQHHVTPKDVSSQQTLADKREEQQMYLLDYLVTQGLESEGSRQTFEKLADAIDAFAAPMREVERRAKEAIAKARGEMA
jgi:hypothetical protein